MNHCGDTLGEIQSSFSFTRCQCFNPLRKMFNAHHIRHRVAHQSKPVRDKMTQGRPSAKPLLTTRICVTGFWEFA